MAPAICNPLAPVWREPQIITHMYGMLIVRQDNPLAPNPPNRDQVVLTLNKLKRTHGFSDACRQEWFVSESAQVIFYVLRDCQL